MSSWDWCISLSVVYFFFFNVVKKNTGRKKLPTLQISAHRIKIFINNLENKICPFIRIRQVLE